MHPANPMHPTAKATHLLLSQELLSILRWRISVPHERRRLAGLTREAHNFTAAGQGPGSPSLKELQ